MFPNLSCKYVDKVADTTVFIISAKGGSALYLSREKLDQAAKSPFRFEQSMIHCVAHTGALGTNLRGREKIEEDWRRIAVSFESSRQFTRRAIAS